MRRAWVIRAGESGTEIDAMRDAGRIGVRYEAIGDAREWTSVQIEQELARTNGKEAAANRSRLMRFTFDVSIGDLVVTPNGVEKDVWISTVTGPYEFDQEAVVPHYPHTRTAEWLGWWPRSSSWLYNKLKYIDTPGPLVELRDPHWWFAQAESVELRRERPDRTRYVAPPRQSAPRRSPSAPKPPPPPKPPEHVLCAGQCGLQWRTAALVDGLCPDCRGD